MALPKPTFLPYQPQQFADVSSAVTLGMQLFGKYHPSQLQQLRYQQMLQEREGKERSAQEELKTIAEERAALRRYQTSFREAGLGPSGKVPLTGSRQAGGGGAGGGAGRGGESMTGVLNAAAKFSANTTDRRGLATEDRNRIERKYDMTSGVGSQLVGDVLRKAESVAGSASGVSTSALLGAIASASGEYFSRIEGVNISGERKEMAAARLFDALKGRYRAKVDSNVAMAIDAVLETPGFLTGALSEGISPSAIIRQRQQAELSGVTAGPDRFEEFAFSKLQTIDTNKDGKVSAEERQTYEQELASFRKAYGLAEPLTDEEEFFLGRYINALSDDGQADLKEFENEAEYQQALAAYEKGRNLESLPRGFARFYDVDYLASKQRDLQLREREAALLGRETPQQQAAQALLGLPTVSAEAFQAAAQVSPRAAEGLPYMIQRYQQANGDVQPRDRVEQTAQQLISRGNRDFNMFMQQIDKLYPNDNDARLKAAAYYGAAQFGADARGSTFDTATQQGNIAGMAQGIQTAERQFASDVERTAAAPVAPPPPVMDPAQAMRAQAAAYVAGFTPDAGQAAYVPAPQPTVMERSGLMGDATISPPSPGPVPLTAREIFVQNNPELFDPVYGQPGGYTAGR